MRAPAAPDHRHPPSHTAAPEAALDGERSLTANEPFTIALLLATAGVLLAVAALSSRITDRLGVPFGLVFLAIGILAGSEGLGGIEFENYGFAFRVGTVALVLILFDGGFNTPLGPMRRVLAPAGVLATIGVVATAALTAVGARLIGFEWNEALLVGAVVSSTDAAAVFSALRASGVHLKRRVGVTLEVESGANDPMAVILTTIVTRNLLEPGSFAGWRLPLDVAIQLGVGLGLGLAVGFGGRALLLRRRLTAGGLYAVLTVALAFLAFGVPTLLYGSGFLAVYVAAVILGNAPIPYRTSLTRVHDALAWLSQVSLFLLLGLLVFPSRLLDVAGVGLVLALFLVIVARPLVVSLCLAPFRFPAREAAFVGWVGLRGAVPIMLATFPVLAGAPGATRLFDVVFFIVVANAVLPGATVVWLARRLGLESREPPGPPAVLTIESLQPLRGELLSFYVDEALAVAGAPLAQLPFPEGASAMMIVRGGELIAPKGDTVIQPGDHVYVVSRPEDRPLLQLMFGRPEEG
ncbi:MAG TPA: potassium/proton antiporter [Gemmatimonadota bacterium]